VRAIRHSGLIQTDVRIHLTIRPFEISIAYQGRAAMTGARDVKYIKVILLDDMIQVDIYKVLAGCRAPVPYYQGLDMREL
jgi:hypothetical protein